MNDYDREVIRRHVARLDEMSDKELAELGLHHLKVSFAVMAPIVVVLLAYAALRPDDAGIPVLLICFSVFCAPFMVVEWFQLRRVVGAKP